jgi:hypothetical protein
LGRSGVAFLKTPWKVRLATWPALSSSWEDCRHAE